MFPTDPRGAIAHMPFVLDREPRDTLMIAGFDADGTLRHRSSHALDGARPLDEPLLESSLWRDDVVFAAAVAYSRTERVPLQPLIDAWGYRGRTTLAAIWAGAQHWRDYQCSASKCCQGAGNRYSSVGSHEPPALPWSVTNTPQSSWRRASWEDWRSAIERASLDEAPATDILERLAQSLFDIPMRDAVLAQSAAPGADAQSAITVILQAIVTRSVLGVSVPAQTCLAAMHYLKSEFDECRALVTDILSVEEYSFARLLLNGLEMRAPASLLARSFATFNPQDLLAA